MQARPLPRPGDEAYEGRLSEGWESEASRWVAWVRRPGHDSFDHFHRERFLELLPAPGRATLDLGSGEGRLGRALRELGHHTVELERSPSLVRAAVAAGSPRAVLGDSARLPFRDSAFDLVVALMSLQDMDDMFGAVAEVARVLEPGGRFCLAVVHPVNSAGRFVSRETDAAFVIEGDYFDRRKYRDTVERDGLELTFHQHHWALMDYFEALEAAGLLTERVREVEPGLEGRWGRIPLFLQVRAVRPAG